MARQPALSGTPTRAILACANGCYATLAPRSAALHGAGPRSAALHGAGPRSAALHGAGPRSAALHGAGPRSAAPHGAGPALSQREREKFAEKSTKVVDYGDL